MSLAPQHMIHLYIRKGIHLFISVPAFDVTAQCQTDIWMHTLCLLRWPQQLFQGLFAKPQFITVAIAGAAADALPSSGCSGI